MDGRELVSSKRFLKMYVNVRPGADYSDIPVWFSIQFALLKLHISSFLDAKWVAVRGGRDSKAEWADDQQKDRRTHLVTKRTEWNLDIPAIEREEVACLLEEDY